MMVVRQEQGSLPGQVFLSIATEHRDLAGVPDGYLNIIWPQAVELSTPATQGINLYQARESDGGRLPAESLGQVAQIGRRELLGYGVLLFVIAATLFLAMRPWPLARGHAGG